MRICSTESVQEKNVEGKSIQREKIFDGVAAAQDEWRATAVRIYLGWDTQQPKKKMSVHVGSLFSFVSVYSDEKRKEREFSPWLSYI